MDALKCSEAFVADTVLLLTRALSEMEFWNDSGETPSDVSSLSDDRSDRRKTISSDDSTDTVYLTRRLWFNRQSVSDETLKNFGAWNPSRGFPFPCPIVRDPTRGGLYIPGEQLGRCFARRRFEEDVVNDPEMNAKVVVKDSRVEGTDSISLREVIRQVPIRLSHMRHGQLDDNLYDAWLYGDPKESLRDRFAKMDKGLRKKFIGLKNSSARVREKVRRKRVTSYKEVADELVEEIGLANTKDEPSAMEAENLKRRVYDVLNVFEAVGLIVKDQKCVYWKGMAEPKERELETLERHFEWLKTRLEKRRQYLEHIRGSYRALTALCAYNKTRHVPEAERLHLPFLLLHAPETVDVDVTVAAQKVQLDFAGEFHLSGDLWALRRLGWHNRSSPLFQKLVKESMPNGMSYKSDYAPGLTPCLNALSTDVPPLMHPFVPLTVENGIDAIETKNLSIPCMDEPMPKRRRTASHSCDDMTCVSVPS